MHALEAMAVKACLASIVLVLVAVLAFPLELLRSWPGEILAARTLHRTHLALTYAAPLYQYLLANAGDYKMSGGESRD
jgi:hypothetical protein